MQVAIEVETGGEGGQDGRQGRTNNCYSTIVSPSINAQEDGGSYTASCINNPEGPFFEVGHLISSSALLQLCSFSSVL